MEDRFYDPDFDPMSLTIPKLKSALVDAGIELPMKQERKAFYVDLFRKHISEKVDILKSKAARVRPSANGIVAVTKNGSPFPEETAETQFQSVAKKRNTRSRKAIVSEETENPFQSASSEDEKSSPSSGSQRKNNVSSKKLVDELDSSRSSKKKTPQKFLDLDTPSLPIAGYIDANSVLRKSESSPKNNMLLSILAFTVCVTIVILSLMTSNIFLPYCESENSTDCTPCPMHAKCKIEKDGVQKIVCDQGYVLRYRPFPVCVLDRQRLSNIERLFMESDIIAAKYAGDALCNNEPSDSSIEPLSDGVLKKELRTLHTSWTDETFEDYWLELSQKLTSRNWEIENYNFKVLTRGDNRFLILSNNPQISLGCRIRKAVWNYRYHAYGSVGVLIMILYGIYSIREKRKYSHKIDELVHGVISLLIEQENRFRRSEEARSSLAINHLRDFFLHQVNLSERSRIWNDVRKTLLLNSSIRETAILIEGEQHDAWQWIGTSTLLSPNKKR